MLFADDPKVQDRVKNEFETDGFAVAPQVLSPEAVSALREKLEALYYGKLDMAEAPVDALRLQIWRHQKDGHASFLHISDLPEVMAVLQDKKLLSAFARCVGAEQLHLFEAVSLIKPKSEDQIFVWHSDFPLFPYQTQDFATLWIAISDCNEQTGGMSMARGSFKTGWAPVDVKQGTPIENNRPGELPPQDPAAKGMPVTRVDMKPGDAVLFHANTLHKSEANSTDGLRIGLPFRFALRPILRDEGKEPVQAAFTKQVEWDSEGHLKNTSALPVVWPNDWQPTT